MNLKIIYLILILTTISGILLGISGEIEKLVVHYHNTMDLEKTIELTNNLNDKAVSDLLKAYFYLADSVEKFYGKSESYIESLMKNVEDIDQENRDLLEVVKILKQWRFDSITRLNGKFERLLNDFPNSSIVILEAMRYYHYNWIRYHDESSYEKLLNLFEKIGVLNPKVATPYVWTIDALEIEKDETRISQIIELALKNCDDSFTLRSFLARFFFEHRDFERALVNSQISLDLKYNVEDLYIFGMSLWNLEKVDEALKVLEKLVELKDFQSLSLKEQTNTYKVLGSIYESKGRLRRAIEFYKLAVKKDSSDPQALKDLGMAYLKTDDPDRETYARYFLNLALKIRPNWPEVEKVLDRINKKFVREAFLKYMLPILILVALLLILLEVVSKIRKKRNLRRLNQ